MGQRRRGVAVLLATALAGLGTLFSVDVVGASPSDEYTRAHFGRDIPAGCKRDTMREYTRSNVCHHIRTDMNGLDAPIVDVLIVAPASPAVERDTRIMRQAVEMWEGGIDYLAPQMGLDWLAKGTDFRIVVETFDVTADNFSLLPLVDPEIVVLATNPVGGAGIGIDPVGENLVGQVAEIVTGRNLGVPDDLPCAGIGPWLFEMDFWDALPGFDSHHGGESGTFAEDCGGLGGNVCFAVNAAVDPAPDRIESVSLFDLVAHEFGHCMSIGHVGDGAEGAWGKVPPNDIMAYDDAPAGLNKCVSTLDLEALAPRMSEYLDVNGDGRRGPADRVFANDPEGDGRNPFQTQHPRDHFYASKTGQPRDCPQPSLGVVPGPRTDWTPDAVPTGRRELTLTRPAAGARTGDASFSVAGTVTRDVAAAAPPRPAAPPATGGPRTVSFTHAGGNEFGAQDSTLGFTTEGRHAFGLDVAELSDVAVTLEWDDALGFTDLDLYVTGAADSGADGAGGGQPERVSLVDVRGHLDIAVDPYLVVPLTGSLHYTLTAVVTPRGSQPDRDGDDTPDATDVCVTIPGSGADGCPMQATERVLVYVDGAASPAASQDVDTTTGGDRFAFPVFVPRGSHTLRIEWASTRGKVYATRTVDVTRT